jgi:hypothetical protein
MLLDVGCYRKEIIVDKAADFLVGIRLGLQPSASASSGSRTKIEQERLVGVFRARQRGVDVTGPLNRHNTSVHYSTGVGTREPRP